MLSYMKTHLPYKLTTIRVFSLSITFIFLSLIFLNLLSSNSPFSSTWMIGFGAKSCDIFSGEWVYSPKETTFYTNFTCPEIFDQQNCMKFGRPDSEFLKWRWRPEKCELPRFNATQFLELVKGKSMAFVGDSLARNQMQSLLCLLSTVENPIDVSNKTRSKKFKRWLYKDSNFTMATFWSPYLIRANEALLHRGQNDKSHESLTDLYLDEANTNWTAHMEGFDYVVISAGRWFFGPKMYHQNGHLIGCHWCLKNDVKNYTMSFGYKEALRTAFKALLGLKGFKGEVVLRTLSPAHFEGGEWNSGGECRRTKPFSRKEKKTRLSWGDYELYLSGVDVFREVKRKWKKKGVKVRLLDVTKAMALRPDGHPNHYGHWASENVTLADCVHWCLPGPIDTWNDFLLH